MSDAPEGFTRMPNGDLVTIAPLTFARGRICVGPDTTFVRDGY
jgi:hypothetical protein